MEKGSSGKAITDMYAFCGHRSHFSQIIYLFAGKKKKKKNVASHQSQTLMAKLNSGTNMRSKPFNIQI